jgi:hypothetical protein
VACIQPNLSSGEAVDSRRIPDTKQLAVRTRRFHYAMVMRRLRFWNASKRVGFSGPTMVLSETQGLSLSLVMRESPIGRGRKALNPGGAGAKPLRPSLLPLRKPASSHNACIGLIFSPSEMRVHRNME